MTREIRLSGVKTDGGHVVVFLAGQDTCPALNQFPKKLSEFKIQVWLLEADGNALVPRPQYTSFRGERNAGCDSNVAQFWFRASSQQPINLVVSVDDVPTIRPIPIHVR